MSEKDKMIGYAMGLTMMLAPYCGEYKLRPISDQKKKIDKKRRKKINKIKRASRKANRK